MIFRLPIINVPSVAREILESFVYLVMLRQAFLLPLRGRRACKQTNDSAKRAVFINDSCLRLIFGRRSFSTDWQVTTNRVIYRYMKIFPDVIDQKRNGMISLLI